MQTVPELLSSGADHLKVAAANPHWDEYEWCRYWELDARKIERKYNIRWERRLDCGDPHCKCKGLKHGTR